MILTVIPEDSAISIDENMRENYSLTGYFARYGNVSLTKKEKLNYHISYKGNNEDKNNYEKIDLNTQMITLYSKNK